MYLSLSLAFLAGLLSMLSPCVLPLVPIDLGTALSQQLVAADIMTMPDEGVPSYATGRHTFMILHDYD